MLRDPSPDVRATDGPTEKVARSPYKCTAPPDCRAPLVRVVATTQKQWKSHWCDILLLMRVVQTAAMYNRAHNKQTTLVPVSRSAHVETTAHTWCNTQCDSSCARDGKLAVHDGNRQWWATGGAMLCKAQMNGEGHCAQSSETTLCCLATWRASAVALRYTLAHASQRWRSLGWLGIQWERAQLTKTLTVDDNDQANDRDPKQNCRRKKLIQKRKYSFYKEQLSDSQNNDTFIVWYRRSWNPVKKSLLAKSTFFFSKKRKCTNNATKTALNSGVITTIVTSKRFPESVGKDRRESRFWPFF